MYENATHYEINSDTDTQGSECDDFSGTTIATVTILPDVVEIGLLITAAAANYRTWKWPVLKSHMLQ